MSKSTITFSESMRVQRGMLLQTHDGKTYVVKNWVWPWSKPTTTLTVVPYRWWHRIPWMTILVFMIGSVVGRWLYWWLNQR